MRDYVTRQEYDAWIAECAALAIACGYPVQDSMINDNTGIVFGADHRQQINDNHFLAPAANAGRLSNDIRET